MGALATILDLDGRPIPVGIQERASTQTSEVAFCDREGWH